MKNIWEGFYSLVKIFREYNPSYTAVEAREAVKFYLTEVYGTIPMYMRNKLEFEKFMTFVKEEK